MRKIVFMTFFMTLMLVISLFTGSAISNKTIELKEAAKNDPSSQNWWDHWNRDINHNGIDDVLDDMMASNPETERTKIFIDYSEHPEKEDVALLSNFDLEIRYIYNIIDTVSARDVLLSDIEKISGLPKVVMVEYEDDVHALLDISAKAVKAEYSDEYTPNTVDEMDILGRGVSVAILDTGVDDGPAPAPPPYHISVDDLDDDIATIDPKFIAGVDVTHVGWLGDGSWNPDDAFVPGHGTHVASTAIGTDAGSDYRGIAPQARLVDVKVMERVGTGSMAEVIRGIEWCVEHKDDDFDDDGFEDGIDIMSMSIGATYNSNGDDAASQAVNAAVDAGIVAVVAIGNDGSNRVPPPASADKAIVVGAINDMGTITRDDDTMWGSSNYGPRMDDGDTDPMDELKPDVVAPGVNILAAKSGTSTVYASYSGTSMATPHVSGVIALMLEANPNLTPQEVKDILHGTSEMPPGVDPSTEYDDVYNFNWGWGMVDAYEAVRLAKQEDTSPPQIYDVNVVDVSSTTATIEWLTNKPSNRIIHYGETQSLGSAWENLNIYETSHTMTIEGLNPNTDYYFNVLGYDEYGNGPGESGIQDPFHTDIVQDTTPPEIVEGPSVLGITDISATIYWKTDEISDSVVDYGLDPTYGNTESDLTDVVDHYITLVGLDSSEEYHYRVQSTDPSGNPKSSSDHTFQTASEPDTTPPEITVKPEAIDITENSAVIIWETDEPSTTLVRYGKTTTYGNETADSTPVLKHSIKLTGLVSSTIYYYQIESKDTSGNEKIYDDANTRFNTTGTPDTTEPSIIDGPEVTILTDSIASIEWETNEKSDSTVEYGLDTGDYGPPESSPDFVFLHNITLTGLSPSTPYHYRVRSKDNSPNANENISEEYTFTTKAPADLKPPKIQAGPYILEVGEDTATIVWTTNEESDSTLHYGTTASYGLIKTDPSLVKEHNVVLTDLSPSTEYHYKISSTDGSGNNVESGDYVFTTLDITVPIEIDFLNLQNGQIVSGVINVEGTVTGGRGNIEWIKYKVDNETYQNLGTGSTFSIVLDTKTLSEGEHTLYVQVKVGEMSMQEDVTFYVDQQDESKEGDMFWLFVFLILVIVLVMVLVISRLRSGRRIEGEDSGYEPLVATSEVPFTMDTFPMDDAGGIGFIPDEPPQDEPLGGISFIPDTTTLSFEPDISFIPDREPISFNIAEEEPIGFAVLDTVRCPKCKKIFNADISKKMECPECGFGADLRR
ncbi:MAG: S8 family serine peptidase [Thermoplasmata archaeon]|nr:MAG: S8 family serine peptidase [Thermoplasmata archaeon]